MTTETQEQEQSSGTTETVNDGERSTSTENTASSEGAAKVGEGDSSSSDDAFDVSSYEESFGLPADTLKGVENAEDALEAIRRYTDKTLTAGLLSKTVGDTTTSNTGAAEGVAKGVESDDVAKTAKMAIKGAGTNPELDALRAKVDGLEEKLAVREKQEQELQFADINRRGYAEIDSWESPRYGTTKSRNFKQAQAVQEVQSLLRTHILGFQVEGKLPPDIEKTLRQVRAHHDDEYRPSSAKKNSDAALGSPGIGSRSAKKGDDGPKNIHEALQQNSFD